MDAQQTINERYLYSICSAEGYALWLEAEKKHQDLIHNVIHSIKMLSGWDIIALDRWKPGVVKYTAERTLHGRRERQIGYAKDEVFESLQLPPNVSDQATASDGRPQT